VKMCHKAADQRSEYDIVGQRDLPRVTSVSLWWNLLRCLLFLPSVLADLN